MSLEQKEGAQFELRNVKLNQYVKGRRVWLKGTRRLRSFICVARKSYRNSNWEGAGALGNNRNTPVKAANENLGNATDPSLHDILVSRRICFPATAEQQQTQGHL